MSASLSKLRRAAAALQSYRCHYCQLPMWEGEPAEFLRRYGVTLRQARLLSCTAEHLQPRSRGGKSHSANIAAAHLFCNAARHRARPERHHEAFKRFVQQRVARGGWLPSRLALLLRSPDVRAGVEA